MNIILCSSKFINGDINYNKSQIINQLKKPAHNKIDFIFFGETYLNGFDSLTWDYFEDEKISGITMDTVKYLGEMAKKYSKGLGFGYFEFVNQSIYSSYIVYDSMGNILCNYRRISKGWRFGYVDTNHYKEGNVIGEFIYREKHFGISLCGDLWDDSLQNELLNKNFDVLVWPVYIDYKPDIWESKVKLEYIIRSKEVASKVLFINSISGNATSGGTYYLSDGELIEETKMSKDQICMFTHLKF